MTEHPKETAEMRVILPVELHAAIKEDGARYRENLSQTATRLLTDALEARKPSRRRRSAQPA